MPRRAAKLTYERPPRTRLYIAILALFTGAVLLGCAGLIGGRYDTDLAVNGYARTDRLTGEVVVCNPGGQCFKTVSPGPFGR